MGGGGLVSQIFVSQEVYSSGTGKEGRRVGCCWKDGWGWARTARGYLGKLSYNIIGVTAPVGIADIGHHGLDFPCAVKAKV